MTTDNQQDGAFQSSTEVSYPTQSSLSKAHSKSDMHETTALEPLYNAGIRVTAVRAMIWRQVRHCTNGVFSLSDLEEAMPTVDKSTLFRTLTLFSDAHLLHTVDDGSGSQKYCVCQHDDTRHCTGHVHLTCRLCHSTVCLTDVKIPQVPLPDGFFPEETEYVVKGICAKCAKRC